ncbi:MAG TPA: hypothetical protein VF062_05695 [Candidatus Limnocylindrales bacterium]
MSTPDNDAELTIALAEYAHINELRNQLEHSGDGGRRRAADPGTQR